MQNQITRWVKNHSVLTFLSLTFASSWIIQIPLALQEQGFLRTHIPFAVHTLSAYGPMLAALLVTGALDGRAGIKELLGRMTRWRVHLHLVAVCCHPADGCRANYHRKWFGTRRRSESERNWSDRFLT